MEKKKNDLMAIIVILVISFYCGLFLLIFLFAYSLDIDVLEIIHENKEELISCITIAFKYICIPTCSIIGMMVYWKNSESMKKKKIIVLVVTMLVVSLEIYIIRDLLTYI